MISTHIYIIKTYLSKHQIIYKSLFFGNPWSLSHTQTDQGPTHRSFHIFDENLRFSIHQWESKTLYVQFHNLSVMKTTIMLRKQAIVEELARFLHKSIKKPIKIGHKLLMWTRKVQWVSPRSVNIFETDRGFLTMRHVQEKLYFVQVNLCLPVLPQFYPIHLQWSLLTGCPCCCNRVLGIYLQLLSL